MADPKSFALDEQVHRYLVEHSTPLDDVRLRLIAATAELGPVARMQVAPEQSSFLTVLTRLLGVRRAVEVGTFTGLSALSIAMGMPDDGHLLCCDVSEEWTDVAREHWADAGVEGRIELRIAPAAETLRSLPADPVIDLAFIDADKGSYVTYWDELVPRLRPGGVVLVDNVLWRGQVVDDSITDDDTEAIRRFNDHALADERVEVVMLPISDGLTLARRR
ncbi:MAG TPA: O-methyltransferase [Acidimicrobiales bacterium]|nr:O-methyltransferase [Acidimicrobiales bacterium]